MYLSVRERIDERRDEVLSTLQGYLESPTFLEDVQNDTINRGELEFEIASSITRTKNSNNSPRNRCQDV